LLIQTILTKNLLYQTFPRTFAILSKQDIAFGIK
jgi:hypothetical protein